MYTLITAASGFRCPISGTRVRPGEVCLEDELGNRVHLNQLPARRLRPIMPANKGLKDFQCPFTKETCQELDSDGRRMINCWECTMSESSADCNDIKPA